MIVAVAMVKDEEDILEPVLRHLLAEGVDHLLVANNLSTDGTEDILDRLEAEGAPLTVVVDPILAYEQARKMSRLARKAYEMGAEWVLPFDADEVWHGVGPDGAPCRIADALAAVDPLTKIIRAPGWDHIVRHNPPTFTDSKYVKDHAPFSPWRRPQTQQLAKVAFRASHDALLHMGNHDVTISGPSVAGPLAFRHFQYRSLEQMARKLRQGREAYEASDVHPMHGVHWREGGKQTDEEMRAQWEALCSEEGLVYDPAPLRVAV